MNFDDISKGAIELVNKVIDIGVEGNIPGAKPSKQLGEEYLKDNKGNHSDAIDSLIRWQTSKNVATGFVSGLGGLITLPASIPFSLFTTCVVQAQMSGAIAHIYGRSLNEDKVRTLILLTLLGDKAKEIVKDVGIRVGTHYVKKIILENVSGQTLREINKKVGIRLITKAGSTGVVNLTKAIPIIGGVVSAGFDGSSTYFVGQTAKEILKAGHIN